MFPVASFLWVRTAVAVRAGREVVVTFVQVGVAEVALRVFQIKPLLVATYTTSELELATSKLVILPLAPPPGHAPGVLVALKSPEMGFHVPEKSVESQTRQVPK